MPALAHDRDAAVRASIEALSTASTTPAKQRKEKASVVVDALCSHAYQHGLTSPQLQNVVGILTRRNELDQTSSTTLVKNLYPAERVPPAIIVAVTGGLGQGQSKPSPATQAALLRWVIAVVDVLEDAAVLSKLYAVLFNLLDTMSLRTPLCHLLSLVTRRKHVRPYRIQQLLEMVRASGQDPALVGLLRVYKDYYPDIIVGNAAAGRASFATPAQDEWRQRLQAIQEAYADRAGQLQAQHDGFRVIRRGAKRTKASIVPDVRTSHANENSVTLEEINNADDLVKHLDRIELPNQLLASFKDPLLQKYLLLNPSDAAARRLELWLESFLREALDAAANGISPPDHFGELLEGMLSYTQTSKILMPTARDFLKAYLPLWDGSTHSEPIIGLLAYVPLQDFNEFQTSYLRPAETAVVSSGTHDAYDRLIALYISLTQNWNHTVNANHNKALPDGADVAQDVQNFTSLTTHISNTILSLLVSLPYVSLTVTNSLLNYYSALASLSSAVTPLTIPPAQTLYSLLFQPSLATLSHLCAVLATYKRAFENDMQPGSSAAQLPRSVTNAFNGYLMDVANLLWRSRALTSQDPNAMACLCPAPLVEYLNAYVTTLSPLYTNPASTTSPAPGTGPEYAVTALFGLAHNAQTCALALAAFRDLEDSSFASSAASSSTGEAAAAAANGSSKPHHPPGPVTQRSLARLSRAGGLELSWKAYRVRVLQWLAEHGVHGVRDFMFVTMKDLMKEAGAGAPGAPGAAGGIAVAAQARVA